MWSLICLLNLVGTFLWSNMASWSFSPLVKFAWKMIKRNLVCATDYQRVSSNWSPLIAESPLITLIKRLSINDHYYTTINKHDSPCWTTQHSSSSIVYCSSKRHILGMCFFVPSFFFWLVPKFWRTKKILDVRAVPPQVTCPCGTSWCFRCGNDVHLPVACETVKRWEEKNRDEGGTGFSRKWSHFKGWLERGVERWRFHHEIWLTCSGFEDVSRCFWGSKMAKIRFWSVKDSYSTIWVGFFKP